MAVISRGCDERGLLEEVVHIMIISDEHCPQNRDGSPSISFKTTIYKPMISPNKTNSLILALSQHTALKHEIMQLFVPD